MRRYVQAYGGEPSRNPASTTARARLHTLEACRRSSAAKPAKLILYILTAGLLMAALAFPFVGGAGAMVNRLSDRTAQDSAQLLEGEVPIISTMVDAAGNPIAWIFTQRRWVGSRQPHRRHHEAGNRLDRGQAIRRAQRRRSPGLADRAGRLPAGRRRHPRWFDDRAAVRQELQLPGERPERRGAPGSDRDHSGAQAARDADGAGARQGAAQGGDPDPVSEPGVVRQRQLRRAGRREDLLRCQRGGPQLAAGGAAGGDGAVDERAQPVHQSRRRRWRDAISCSTP